MTFLGGTGALVERLCAQPLCDPAAPLGDLLGVVPLHGDRARATPFGTMLGGTGLDARLFTDLSRLQPDRLVTPTEEMFVRTAAPAAAQAMLPTWSIAARGFGPGARATSVEALRREARPMGAHLIECSGNVDPDNFGLMSVTEWDGVPLAQVLSDLRGTGRSTAWAVMVGGLDDTRQDSRTSTAGANWVFPLDTLERLGAFLAVRMNGEPLTPNHGAPVRLVVPGWYGCSWIKWVN
ncbi:MAG: molybdopterin-dependent oxidoreductase, partial [Vicinamibacterales bacterium]